MFNMGGGELIVVGILALILIPPEKLPGVATKLGRYVRTIQRSLEEVKGSFKDGLKADNAPPVKRPEIPPQNTSQNSTEGDKA
ncbi:twin-arginine translocase TatA/TatE family subunit [bacterium]|nr:twin-arginine translocase TatA/TatE family subunit [bacterium]